MWKVPKTKKLNDILEDTLADRSDLAAAIVRTCQLRRDVTSCFGGYLHFSGEPCDKMHLLVCITEVASNSIDIAVQDSVIQVTSWRDLARWRVK